MPPRLSAIICTHNRYHVLGDAIASLRAQKLDHGSLEIIIIDNSADQAQAELFGAAYDNIPGLLYICEPVVGLSNARNAGLDQAKSAIAAFIDDDAIAAPGWAQAMLDAFASFGDRAGAIGGPVRPRWPGPRPSWLGDDLLTSLALIDRGVTMHETQPDQSIVGCNMALDRQLTLELGGFSRQLGRTGSDITLVSNEESALLARMKTAGRAIVYTPGAAVEHVIDPSRLTQTWFRRRAAWQAVSDYLMDPAGFTAYAHTAASQLRPSKPETTMENSNAEQAAAFSAQFWVTYHATLAALTGQPLPMEPPASWRLKWRAAILKGRIFALTQKQSGTARLGRLGLQGYRRLMGR